MEDCPVVVDLSLATDLGRAQVGDPDLDLRVWRQVAREDIAADDCPAVSRDAGDAETMIRSVWPDAVPLVLSLPKGGAKAVLAYPFRKERSQTATLLRRQVSARAATPALALCAAAVKLAIKRYAETAAGG